MFNCWSLSENVGYINGQAQPEGKARQTNLSPDYSLHAYCTDNTIHTFCLSLLSCFVSCSSHSELHPGPPLRPILSVCRVLFHAWWCRAWSRCGGPARACRHCQPHLWLCTCCRHAWRGPAVWGWAATSDSQSTAPQASFPPTRQVLERFYQFYPDQIFKNNWWILRTDWFNWQDEGDHITYTCIIRKDWSNKIWTVELYLLFSTVQLGVWKTLLTAVWWFSLP